MGKAKRSHFKGKISRKADHPMAKSSNKRKWEKDVTSDFATHMLPSLKLGQVDFTVITRSKKGK